MLSCGGFAQAAGQVNEAAMQIAFADRILLNKTDLVSAEDTARLTATIRSVNAVAPIQQCERCVVDLGWLLDVHAFDPQRAKELEQSLSPLYEGIGGGAGHGGPFQGFMVPVDDGGGDGRKLMPKHDTSVRTVALHLVGKPVDSSKVEQWLAGLLWDDGEPLAEPEGDGGAAGSEEKTELFRVKGVLAVGGTERKWVVQAVHEIFEVVESEHRWDGVEPAARTSKMVFIGRQLDQAALQAGLEGCAS